MTSPPRHIAFIMDGNSRWARARGLPVAEGHRMGVNALRRVIKHCGELGVRVITVFAFSSENWQRSSEEVDHLMQLFCETLESTLPEFIEQGVALRVIGKRDQLDPALVELIQSAEESTKAGRYTLVVALNYSGRQDIVEAARRLAKKARDGELDPADLNVDNFGAQLAAADLPPPDLCIRTSNEQRISNFMLWQLAYTELYFCDTLWPDFDAKHLDKALADYARRQRRFGARETPVPITAGVQSITPGNASH